MTYERRTIETVVVPTTTRKRNSIMKRAQVIALAIALQTTGLGGCKQSKPSLASVKADGDGEGEADGTEAGGQVVPQDYLDALEALKKKLVEKGVAVES